MHPAFKTIENDRAEAYRAIAGDDGCGLGVLFRDYGIPGAKDQTANATLAEIEQEFEACR